MYGLVLDLGTMYVVVCIHMFDEAIRQAKITGAVLITTYAAFVGFDDLMEFLQKASKEEVTVTFAPIGKDNA